MILDKRMVRFRVYGVVMDGFLAEGGFERFFWYLRVEKKYEIGSEGLEDQIEIFLDF